MAIALPIFLFVIFGIVEFGRAFMVEHLLAEAARLGARRSIIEGSENSEIEALVKDHCADHLGVSADHVDVSISVGPASPGNLAAAAIANQVDRLPTPGRVTMTQQAMR